MTPKIKLRIDQIRRGEIPKGYIRTPYLGAVKQRMHPTGLRILVRGGKWKKCCTPEYGACALFPVPSISSIRCGHGKERLGLCARQEW